MDVVNATRILSARRCVAQNCGPAVHCPLNASHWPTAIPKGPWTSCCDPGGALSRISADDQAWRACSASVISLRVADNQSYVIFRISDFVLLVMLLFILAFHSLQHLIYLFETWNHIFTKTCPHCTDVKNASARYSERS